MVKALIFGDQIQKSGDKYIGQWKDGKKSGFGKLISSDGEIYIGEFLNNKKMGKEFLFLQEKKKNLVNGKMEKKFNILKFYLS